LTPEILVQIVHIDGPRRGHIDESYKNNITIGRTPSCDVVFPADMRIVSRKHAEIIREGNRFLLKSLGRNGCFVNGKLVEQAYLKQGDVIALAEGGPKISFLSTMKPAHTTAPGETPPALHRPPQQLDTPTPHTAVPIPPSPSTEKAPFTLQYGVQIKTLTQTRVKIGKDDSCDFCLQHPSIFNAHIELYYQNKQYFIKDLTGNHATYINHRPLTSSTALHESDIIMLGENGPQFRYLGTGRFAELIEPSPSAEDTHLDMEDSILTHKAFTTPADEAPKKSLLKSIFKGKN